MTPLSPQQRQASQQQQTTWGNQNSNDANDSCRSMDYSFTTVSMLLGMEEFPNTNAAITNSNNNDSDHFDIAILHESIQRWLTSSNNDHGNDNDQDCHNNSNDDENDVQIQTCTLPPNLSHKKCTVPQRSNQIRRMSHRRLYNEDAVDVFVVPEIAAATATNTLCHQDRQRSNCHPAPPRRMHSLDRNDKENHRHDNILDTMTSTKGISTLKPFPRRTKSFDASLPFGPMIRMSSTQLLLQPAASNKDENKTSTTATLTTTPIPTNITNPRRVISKWKSTSYLGDSVCRLKIIPDHPEENDDDTSVVLPTTSTTSMQSSKISSSTCSSSSRNHTDSSSSSGSSESWFFSIMDIENSDVCMDRKVVVDENHDSNRMIMDTKYMCNNGNVIHPTTATSPDTTSTPPDTSISETRTVIDAKADCMSSFNNRRLVNNTDPDSSSVKLAATSDEIVESNDDHIHDGVATTGHDDASKQNLQVDVDDDDDDDDSSRNSESDGHDSDVQMPVTTDVTLCLTKPINTDLSLDSCNNIITAPLSTILECRPLLSQHSFRLTDRSTALSTTQPLDTKVALSMRRNLIKRGESVRGLLVPATSF